MTARQLNHVLTPPAEYEARRSGSFHRRRVDTILAAMTVSEPICIAGELGCGTGAVLADVAHSRANVSFVGVDVDEPLLRYAREHHAPPNVTYELSDATEIAGREFDFLFSIDFVHHLHDHLATLRAIRQRLRSGGAWVLIEPNVWHPVMAWKQERMKRQGLGEDHFYPRRMQRLFSSTGFEVGMKRYLHALPASVNATAPRLAKLEQMAERLPPLGASVIYVLRAV